MVNLKKNTSNDKSKKITDIVDKIISVDLMDIDNVTLLISIELLFLLF